MEKLNDLQQVLRHEIEDLFSAEEQIIDAMPAMIEKATNQSLKQALEKHLRITEEQRNRLEKVREILPQQNEGDEEKTGFIAGLFSGGGKQVCKGMQGIIEEGNKMVQQNMAAEVLDAVIIACAQKIEHYEICGYGTVKAYARELELQEAENLLEQTLSEEYEADDLLTELAVGKGVNRLAENAGSRSSRRTGGESRKSNFKQANDSGKAKAAAKKAAPKKAAKKAVAKKTAKKAAPKKAAKKAASR